MNHIQDLNSVISKCLYPFVSCFLFFSYYTGQVEAVFQINSECLQASSTLQDLITR